MPQRQCSSTVHSVSGWPTPCCRHRRGPCCDVCGFCGVTPVHREAGGQRRLGRSSGSSLGNGSQQQRVQTALHPAGKSTDENKQQFVNVFKKRAENVAPLNLTNLEVRLEYMFCTSGDQLSYSYSLKKKKHTTRRILFIFLNLNCVLMLLVRFEESDLHRCALAGL